LHSLSPHRHHGDDYCIGRSSWNILLGPDRGIYFSNKENPTDTQFELPKDMMAGFAGINYYCSGSEAGAENDSENDEGAGGGAESIAVDGAGGGRKKRPSAKGAGGKKKCQTTRKPQVDCSCCHAPSDRGQAGKGLKCSR
jgi:hypothetical protein